MTRVTFSATVWRWSGDAAWFFVTLPEEKVAEVRLHRLSSGAARAGGMVKVRASTGGVEWITSLFSTKNGDYLLPLKAEVRRRAGLAAGDEIVLTLELLQ